MINYVDIVIVGGGAAGIGAARRLALSNYSSLLIEAEPRLGGRAWTREISGLRLDLGCGWFHSADRNAWIGIAEAAGVAVDRTLPQWRVQYRDLGFPKEDQAAAWRAFSAWMQRMEQSPPSNDNAADALVPGGEWNNYIRNVVGFISGARLESLSVADYLAYDDASSDNNWRVPSGYGSLVASSVPATTVVHLATPVDAIELAAGGVTVSTPAGRVRARAAIITVSTAVLAGDTLKLPPALAPWREAAAALPLGHNEKFFLQVEGGPFKAETQLLGSPCEARTGSYYIRPLGAPVIECFFGADSAKLLEDGGAAAGYDYAIGQLSALLGSDIRRTLRPLAASDWSQRPHIGGAYSYALPGRVAARKLLARPFENRVFFAGEATSSGDFSTAHGAHDSGARAAEEVIATLTRAVPP